MLDIAVHKLSRGTLKLSTVIQSALGAMSEAVKKNDRECNTLLESLKKTTLGFAATMRSAGTAIEAWQWPEEEPSTMQVIGASSNAPVTIHSLIRQPCLLERY